MLLILVDTVYDLRINRHFLIPVSLQAIQRSGLDQIFHNPLVDLVDISLNKCFQRGIFSVLLTLPHDPSITGRPILLMAESA